MVALHHSAAPVYRIKEKEERKGNLRVTSYTNPSDYCCGINMRKPLNQIIVYDIMCIHSGTMTPRQVGYHEGGGTNTLP